MAGSDERFFEEFENASRGADLYLMENRRSVPPIVRAANYFENTFKKAMGLYLLKGKTRFCRIGISSGSGRGGQMGSEGNCLRRSKRKMPFQRLCHSSAECG